MATGSCVFNSEPLTVGGFQNIGIIEELAKKRLGGVRLQTGYDDDSKVNKNSGPDSLERLPENEIGNAFKVKVNGKDYVRIKYLDNQKIYATLSWDISRERWIGTTYEGVLIDYNCISQVPIELKMGPYELNPQAKEKILQAYGIERDEIVCREISKIRPSELERIAKKH